MNDPFRVSGCQCRSNLAADLQDVGGRQRAFTEAGVERLAFAEFHYEIIRPDVVKGANVRMIQRCNGEGLAFEPMAESLPREFDCDGPAQARVDATERVPLKRFAAPEEVVAAIRFLAFDAPFATGTTFELDGGTTMV